ncbi:hypothetical protein LCGC14_0854840 [marine sediment metagenome]|uniref:Uncharacterized protein n=1 Tax=marine sediment metagenome TaxID=412755 RepID=A0A0F9SG72_9ZZZZ
MKTIYVTEKMKKMIQYWFNIFTLIFIPFLMIHFSSEGFISDIFPNGYILIGLFGYLLYFLYIAFLVGYLPTKLIEIKTISREQSKS